MSELEGDKHIQKWLVKSNSSVSGPFSFDEVVQSIFTGDTHVLDEIQGPFERWIPIRDNSLFSAAIERLKATTYSRREFTHTDADMATEDITQGVLGDTKTVDIPLDSATREIDSFTPTAEVEKTRIAPQGVVGASVFPDPPGPKVHVRESRAATGGFPWGLLAACTVAVCLVGAYLLLEMDAGQEPAPTATVPPVDEAFAFTDRAEVALSQGDLVTALSEFRQASLLKPNDPDIAMAQAPLEFLLGDDRVSGQIQKMEEVLAQGASARQAKGRSLVGLGYALLGQHSKAVAQFENALSVEESYFAAWANKGYSLMVLQKHEEAIKALNEAMQVSAKDGYFARYLLVRAYVEHGIKSQNEKSFQEAIDHANYYVNRLKVFDFRQEVLFFKALAAKHLGTERKELREAVRAAMTVDPGLSSLHNHDPEWNFKSFAWTSMGAHCNSLVNSLQDVDSEILQAFCALKMGQTLQAKNQLLRLQPDHPRDGLLQGLLVATEMTRTQADVEKFLPLHSDLEEKELFAGISMRACLAKASQECADKVQVMMESAIDPLYQNWFRAEKFKESQKTLARKALGRGIDMSHRFSPFLRLRREL